jgi:hypothetical protein
MAAGSVVTPAGPDKGCDLAVELGKKTGTVKLEPGKTYCVLAARVQSTSTIDDVRKALPSTCKEDRRRGGTHLFCTEEGVRFAFAGPPGTLDSIAVFPKGDPSAGGFH